MAEFSVQSKLLRVLLLSASKQTAYGTMLADAALTRVQRFDGGAVLDLTPERRSDAAMSGKGSSFATNGQITSLDTKITGIKAELSGWLAGYLFAFCMGKVVTTTPSAGIYQHVCNFDESTRTAVATSAFLKDTADLSYKLPDLVLTNFTLTIPATGSITAEFDLIGTGRYTLAALANAIPAVPDEDYLLGSDTDFLFGPVGNSLSILGRHMSSTIKLDMQAVVHRAPGGGLTAIFVRRGDPKFSINSVIAAKETDDVFTNLASNTKVAIQYNVNSGAKAKLSIAVPSVNLKTAKLGFDDDMPVWNVEMDETTCYQVAGVPPITATITNGQASYLAAYVSP